eukprot:CAMPEP_0119345090 /NCGR_PEP_ID=MMETSP1333-20130426/107305_1 /TAXON_ID=418940 /ORGANISM="Scyphosphaera apsteinii, Strain RCC1455" /LENGTH=537 /DNA_ID=CAMNT_0007357543 /DNA_START=37 /DNA_END=1647 /DNA_ORIENTATION=+
MGGMLILWCIAQLGSAAIFDEQHESRVPHSFIPNGMVWPYVHTYSDTWIRVNTNANGKLFTSNFLGTNVPLFSPWDKLKDEVLPLLYAAGITLWRWPGGSIGNAWCATVTGEQWDSCFKQFSVFRKWDDGYPTAIDSTHLSHFIEACASYNCRPMVQINAGIRDLDEPHDSRVPHSFVPNGMAWPHVHTSSITWVNVNTNANGKMFTSNFLGTNIPLYSPWDKLKDEVLPLLYAAGIKLWRWPGGSIGNAWCATFAGEQWDSCFNQFAAFRNDGYPTAKDSTHLSHFIEACASYNCRPMVQINAGIALKYGSSACATYTIKLIQSFYDAGIELKYLEFGNELYGKWSVPWGQIYYSGRDYGKAYSEVRRRVKNHFNGRTLYFGLVVNTDGPNGCGGNHICNWVDDILQKTSAGREADWLIMHRYFSDWGDAAVLDQTILGSGAHGLDQVTSILTNHWNKRLGSHSRIPLIGLTEYSVIFMRSAACGAAQQYISFLWQVKFIGESVSRGSSYGALNQYSAFAAYKDCDHTWGSGLKRA